MSTASGASPLGLFFGTIWGVLVNPVETMRDIDDRRPWVQGLIVLVLVGLFAGLSRSIATGDAYVESFNLGVQTPVAGILVPGWAVIMLVAVTAQVGLLWVMSRIFGGRASFAALFAGACFIYWIFILNNLLRLILSPFMAYETLVIISAAAAMCIITWQVALHVILVAETNGFSTARAILPAIIPTVIIWGILSGGIAWVVLTALDRLG